MKTNHNKKIHIYGGFIMGNVKKMIMFVVGLLITIAVIAYSLGYFTKSKNLSSAVDSGMNDTQQSLQTTQYSGYETNRLVSGTEAITAINKFASSTFTVTVTTKAGSTVAYNTQTGYTVNNPSLSNYIEPSGSFKCTLGTSSNGTQNSLTLVQQ
jgi:hypothetical protein